MNFYFFILMWESVDLPEAAGVRNENPYNILLRTNSETNVRETVEILLPTVKRWGRKSTKITL